MKWWMEEWLPSFFHKAAEGDLLGMFEADHYTLDRVEGLLDAAPAHLFHLYKVNPQAVLFGLASGYLQSAADAPGCSRRNDQEIGGMPRFYPSEKR